MPNKKRLKCSRHLKTGRSWDAYFHWCTWEDGTEIWKCKQCHEAEEKWRLDYEKHKKEREKSHEIYWEKVRIRQEKIQQSQFDDMWDFFIKNELVKGMKLKGYQKGLFKDAIPKELLQLKRATLKLQRLIDQKKKGIREANDKTKEEQERLKRPLVECRKHGSLFVNDVIKGGKSRWTGEQRYKCRQCMSETHKDYYVRRKDFVLEKAAKYRAENQEKVREIKADYYRRKKHGQNRKHENVT